MHTGTEETCFGGPASVRLPEREWVRRHVDRANTSAIGRLAVRYDPLGRTRLAGQRLRICYSTGRVHYTWRKRSTPPDFGKLAPLPACVSRAYPHQLPPAMPSSHMKRSSMRPGKTTFDLSCSSVSPKPIPRKLERRKRMRTAAPSSRIWATIRWGADSSAIWRITCAAETSS